MSNHKSSKPIPDWFVKAHEAATTRTKLQQAVYEAEGETQTTLALGFVRYEFVRKLTPSMFHVIWSQSMSDQKPLDDIIDELIEEEAK